MVIYFCRRVFKWITNYQWKVFYFLDPRDLFYRPQPSFTIYFPFSIKSSYFRLLTFNEIHELRDIPLVMYITCFGFKRFLNFKDTWENEKFGDQYCSSFFVDNITTGKLGFQRNENSSQNDPRRTDWSNCFRKLLCCFKIIGEFFDIISMNRRVRLKGLRIAKI